MESKSVTTNFLCGNGNSDNKDNRSLSKLGTREFNGLIVIAIPILK